jgi:glutathionylspermidine synthase
MHRVAQQPRKDWRRRLNDVGMTFHSIDEEGGDRSNDTDKFLYWREDVAYRFTEAQIETVYEATRELHAMCMDLAGDLVRSGDLARLGIGAFAQWLIEDSWRRKDVHLYGRFDLSMMDDTPKLLEYNADTPTSIVETAVAQWSWLQDVHPGADQFNSLHEALIERWKHIAAVKGIKSVHLACGYDSQEDVGNVEYMMDVVVQAGLSASMLEVADIGVVEGRGAAADRRFVDLSGRPIEACFKLYPWEWMINDPFSSNLRQSETIWVEPCWKMLLSNKAILALLWERHAGHPNLLEAHFSPEPFGAGTYVKKPLLSREGANVSVHQSKETFLETGGSYGKEGFVYQVLCPVPSFPAPESTSFHGPQFAMHAVIGSWVVGDESVGMCIREDVSPVTKNTSYFVPHYFE